ncbi:MAG: SCO family protein [Nitrosomonas sp.]|nr:SCO family protein [Nitrosomonas sp.]
MSHITKIILITLIGFTLASPVLAQVAINNTQSDDKNARARNYFGDEILIDQDGKSHRFYSDLLSDRIVLINVIFTYCKDACPLLTQHLRMVKQQLGKRFGAEFRFLSLSVDPEHDTPELLKRFAIKQYADVPGWRFLVAEKAIMAKVLGRFGQWTEDPNNHGTLLIAGNTRKAHWIKIRPDSPPERIVADLLRLSE